VELKVAIKIDMCETGLAAVEGLCWSYLRRGLGMLQDIVCFMK
jgi:hypothetical protein